MHTCMKIILDEKLGVRFMLILRVRVGGTGCVMVGLSLVHFEFTSSYLNTAQQ